MARSRLSSDIIALIHQVELNKEGWLEARKSKAISAIFWLENRPLTAEEIAHFQGQAGLSGLRDRLRKGIPMGADS